MVSLKRKSNLKQKKTSDIKPKKQNAITLISLVITIIVLLILAGVTINLTLGSNGIFNTAQKVAKNYTEAQNKELGDLEKFDNTATEIIQNVTGENNLSQKAKVGDYVKYIPTAKVFSMTPEQTGQAENQDYNTGDYIGLWQVLYNDREHGLQIISADTVGNLTLGGSGTNVEKLEANSKLSYNNAVDTLNNFCSNYVDKRYAISGRSVGSNPISPLDAIKDTGLLLFAHKGTKESGCKIADNNYKLDYETMKVATNQNTNGISNIGKAYWLASRVVGSNASEAFFAIRNVDEAGNTGYLGVWQITSDNKAYHDKYERGMRPVVTLLSDIKVANGSGTKEAPYELVAK